MPIDSHTLSYLTRLIHVAAMAILLGGSWSIWFVLALRAGDGAAQVSLSALMQYERLAWIALGLLALTGVGNLGVFGVFLPESGTAWGQKLTAKLVLVLILLALSIYRSFAVVAIRLQAHPEGPSKPLARLRILYAATGLMGAAILALAVSLSHG